MSFKIVTDFPNDILDETEAPFISLYQPTHRHRPDNQQDPIRFRNLIKEIEDSLKESYSRKEVESIMKPFHTLAADAHFWNHTLDGLAILATKDRGVIYKLQRPVKEIAIVAPNFHIKPLIRVFQSADRYQLLGLNRNEFVLYEGNRYGFDEIQLEPGTPQTIEEMLGEEDSEKYLTPGVYAGTGGVGAFHGHGGRKEDIEKNTRKFFTQVDRFVTENFSKPSGLPLILVALTEHHSLFQSVSHNPLLLKDGIKTAFDAMSIEKLRKNVWESIEPLYLEKTNQLVGSFKAAWAKFLASDDLVQIANAAAENRVATLLIESDKIVPGRVDPTNGKIAAGDLQHPEYGDVLNDLAEMVLKGKGEVVVLPAERMPVKTGAAATFRY